MKETIKRYGRYGFILALVLFLPGLYFGQGMDFSSQELIAYLIMTVSLSFVFFGIKHFRDKINYGNIGLRRAVLLGLLISVLTASGIALAHFIYTTVIHPEFFDEYTSIMRTEGFRGEIPDYGSVFMAFVMFMTVMIIGLVISLFSAILLQHYKKRNEI